MTDMTVANTILQQLGGGRFIAMTGAKNLVGSDNALTFAIPMIEGINRVRVTLDASDTYTVDFMRVAKRGLDVATLLTVGDVYNDRLQAVFTRATGLRTSL